MMGIGGLGFGRGQVEMSKAAANRSKERMASGKRINGAADDAANLATVQQFLAIEAGAAQGARNLADGQSMVRVAEGALSGTSDLLGRMRELVVQGQNGTYSEEDRAAIQQEYDQLAAEVTRISQSTEFNGKQLLDGSASGSGAVALSDGTGQPVSIDISAQTAGDLGVQGSISDPDALSRLDGAIDSVATTRGQLGAIDNRLDSQIRNLQTQEENTAAARSRIEDADYAAEASKGTQQNILSQTQLALLAQGRLESTAVLGLLS